MKLKDVLAKYDSGDVIKLTYESVTLDTSSPEMLLSYDTRTDTFVVHKVGRKHYLINVYEKETRAEILAYLKSCEDFDTVYFGKCKTIKAILKEILKDDTTAKDSAKFEADYVLAESFVLHLTNDDALTLNV